MKTIPLTQGKHAVVDDEDYVYLSQFKWYADKSANTYYAKRRVRLIRGGSQGTVNMHHAILGKPIRGMVVDHINRNGLDNRRINLRVVTNHVNLLNAGMFRHNTSGYKGAFYHKKGKRWYAQIRVNGKKIAVWSFDNPKDAAAAYNKLVEEYREPFFYKNPLD